MKKIISSFSYALQGIAACFTSETNFKIHVMAACGATGIGLWLHINATEWCILLLCVAIVMSLELVNTAIEKLCDMVSPQKNNVIKKIKDMAASAVLIAAMSSCICGITIFLPKIIVLLKIYKHAQAIFIYTFTA
jgi:diacylglycerol kinase